ncbi:MAG: diversity-generating retroelement protein Avd [Desulfobacterales bacterium]|nr:diversity-generating retroelement protein Avd [Desulfobacterales bacterium]
MKEKYPIFIKWLNAMDWILNNVELFPKSARFTVSSRIANLTLDVAENIIEAIYTKERAHILDKINMQLEKLRMLYRICYKRKYISSTQHEYISGVFNETGKMVGGWRKK